MKKPLSSFVLKQSGINLPLCLGRNVIRRHRDTPNHRFWSRHHCEIYVREKENRSLIILIDKSLNGTYVNTSHIHKQGVFLHPQDEIGFGHPQMTFKLEKMETINID